MSTAASKRLAPALLATLVLAAPSLAYALDVPPLRGRVNDLAGLLEPAARAALEQKLGTYESRTGQQFALLVIPTLEDEALEDYAMRVVERWQLGKRGKDDGLLLLVVTDARKIRVENGYGLEGVITDAFASRVIRDVISPAFKAQDYAGGIDRAFDALMRAASGEVVELAAPEAEARRGPRGGSILPILLVVILLVLTSGGRRRRRGIWFAAPGMFGGGSRGGGFGGFSGGGGRFGGGGASGGW